jgi:hypothetical protein
MASSTVSGGACSSPPMTLDQQRTGRGLVLKLGAEQGESAPA